MDRKIEGIMAAEGRLSSAPNFDLLGGAGMVRVRVLIVCLTLLVAGLLLAEYGSKYAAIRAEIGQQERIMAQAVKEMGTAFPEGGPLVLAALYGSAGSAYLDAQKRIAELEQEREATRRRATLPVFATLAVGLTVALLLPNRRPTRNGYVEGWPALTRVDNPRHVGSHPGALGGKEA
ncbi:MAG: hypothetical protein AB1645_01435 [Bacillota bacterium]